MKTPDQRFLKISLMGSAVAFGVGLFAPCITIHPGYGPLSFLVKLINSGMVQKSSYSIAGGIHSMIVHGDLFVGMILLLFSVLFPLWKMGLFYSYLTEDEHTGRTHRLLWFAHSFGKFSMSDVLVLALLVITITGLPGGTEVSINWGIVPFTASILLTLYVSFKIEAEEQRSNKDSGDSLGTER